MELTQRNEMAVMGPEGDVKHTWNPASPDEVQIARETFQRLVMDKKYTAYKMNADGTKGEQIRAFNPEAANILMVPQMVGG